MALSIAAKKIKKTWLAALRSGKYKQTKGTLYNVDTKSFCCLGVLEHKLLGGKVECTVEYSAEPLSYPSIAFYNRYEGTTWIKNNEPALIALNDNEGASFKEIAAYIQKNWR